MNAFRTAKWFEPEDRADFRCAQCNTVHVGADRPRLDHNGRCEACRGYCNGVDCECPVDCECTHSETCGACPFAHERNPSRTLRGGVVIACDPADQWATVPTACDGEQVLFATSLGRPFVETYGASLGYFRSIDDFGMVTHSTHERVLRFAARLFAKMIAND